MQDLGTMRIEEEHEETMIRLVCHMDDKMYTALAEYGLALIKEDSEALVSYAIESALKDMVRRGEAGENILDNDGDGDAADGGGAGATDNDA
jgi:hypothetical protein